MQRGRGDHTTVVFKRQAEGGKKNISTDSLVTRLQGAGFDLLIANAHHIPGASRRFSVSILVSPCQPATHAGSHDLEVFVEWGRLEPSQGSQWGFYFFDIGVCSVFRVPRRFFFALRVAHTCTPFDRVSSALESSRSAPLPHGASSTRSSCVSGCKVREC